MRLLREIRDESSARKFSDALAASGIEVELSPTQHDTYNVWVINETDMPRAQELSSAWLDRGDSAALELAASKGRAARELSQRIEERKQRQRQAVAERMLAMTRPRPTPLTWGLLALCVAVGALTQLGDERSMVAALTIADPREPIGVQLFSLGGRSYRWLELPWSEPWRLVTPMLVHFGFIHIFFNLLWLRDLGRLVEAVHGARYLAMFVLVSAVVSNVAQYEIAQSPLFAGMSGVVYALLGMLWMRGRLDPRVGYRLSTSTVQFMLIWLVLGFVGNFGMANWCHLFGLLVGVSWGYLAAKLAARH